VSDLTLRDIEYRLGYAVRDMTNPDERIQKQGMAAANDLWQELQQQRAPRPQGHGGSAKVINILA